jgi:hypothetical protein
MIIMLAVAGVYATLQLTGTWDRIPAVKRMKQPKHVRDAEKRKREGRTRRPNDDSADNQQGRS